MTGKRFCENRWKINIGLERNGCFKAEFCENRWKINIRLEINRCFETEFKENKWRMNMTEKKIGLALVRSKPNLFKYIIMKKGGELESSSIL